MTLKRLAALWPFVWRSTLEAEKLAHKSDLQYFEQVHRQDQNEIKRLHLINDEKQKILVTKEERIQYLKKELADIIKGKGLSVVPQQRLAKSEQEKREKLPAAKIEQSIHLAEIQSGDNWQAQESKYNQVKNHYRNFKRQTASVVRKIKETPQPETMEQALGFFSAMIYAAEELELSGAYDPNLTIDDIKAIYGSLEAVPTYLLSDSLKQEQQKLIEAQS